MTAGALALVLLSAFLHAAWNAAAKGSGDPAPFVFVADATALCLLVPVLFLFRWADLTPEVWLMVLATGAIHGVYAWGLTRAYESGELTLVYPISRSTPAFVPFLAVPLLGERVTAGGALGIALVLAGVWLVSTNARLAGERLLTPELRFAYLTLGATVAYSLVDKRAMDLLDRNPWTGPAPRAVVYYVLLCASYLPFFYLLVVDAPRASRAAARSTCAACRSPRFHSRYARRKKPPSGLNPHETSGGGLETNRRTGDGGVGRTPDLHEAPAHREGLVLVAQADRAAEEARHRAAHVVQRVEHEEGVLQLADLLPRAIDLDGVGVAGEEGHHARALAREVLGVVHHHIDAPGAAR